MCTLVALHRVVPWAPLVVAANRDEFYERPAEGPALRATASGTILGPRDVVAGGTWFGLNRSGVFAALTNVACPSPDPDRRSRGLLVVDALAASSAEAAAEKLQGLPMGAYNPFNLWVADRERAFAFTYEESLRQVPGESGVALVGNAALDAEEPAKLARLRERVEAATGAGDREDWLDELAGFCADHTPAGPRGALDAPCVHTPSYGTRSSFLLQLAEDGFNDSRSEFRYADAAPCSRPFEDFTPLLRDLGQGRPGVQGAPLARSHR